MIKARTELRSGDQLITPVVFDEHAYHLTTSAWREYMESIEVAKRLVEQGKKL